MSEGEKAARSNKVAMPKVVAIVAAEQFNHHRHDGIHDRVGTKLYFLCEDGSVWREHYKKGLERFVNPGAMVFPRDV